MEFPSVRRGERSSLLTGKGFLSLSFPLTFPVRETLNYFDTQLADTLNLTPNLDSSLVADWKASLSGCAAYSGIVEHPSNLVPNLIPSLV